MRKILAGILIAFFLFTQVALLFIVLKPLFVPRWYINVETGKIDINDYSHYYMSGQLAVSPKAHSTYDPLVQKEWFDNLTAPLKETRGVFYSKQPPYLHALMIPLSSLPFNISHVIWSVSQLIFGLAALVFMMSNLTERRRRDKAIIVMWSLATISAYLSLWHGNTTFWLLGAWSLYITWFLKGKDIRAGLAMAFSTFKPQYSFLMLVPSVVLSRWRLLAVFFVVETLLMALGGLFIGFENVINYPKVLHFAESDKSLIGVNPRLMVCLRGVLAAFMPLDQSLFVSSLIMFVSLIPLGWFWFKTREGRWADHTVKLWLWSLLIVFAVTISPHSHVHDCLLIAIPAALTLPTLSPVDALRIKPLSLRLWTLIIFSMPFIGWWGNFFLDREGAFPVILFLLNTGLLLSGVIYLGSLVREPAGQRQGAADAVAT